jgi:hypothetical protein
VRSPSPFRRSRAAGQGEGKRARAGNKAGREKCSADEYLGSDAVFAVKDSLICDFVRHDAPEGGTARLGIGPPYYTAEYDFRLKPAADQKTTVLDAQQRLAVLGPRAAE